MCTSSCLTQDHASWGECVRSKHLAVMDGSLRVERANWDADLAAYESARKQGVQPAATTRQAVDDAMILSDLSGTAFQA